MGHRVDFSANASIYDRRHGTMLALEAAQELAQRGGLQPGYRVLEIGAGTGRVAIAFAGLGYETVAFDSALSMLKELRRKAPESQIHMVAGEGARLPFAEGYFDAVILARVLYLMADWQTVLRQAYDVLKPGGCLFHEWGNGQADEPWVQIREKARSLFQEAGVDNPFHPGARSEAEVGAFLADLGFDRSSEWKIGPGPSMTLHDFVGRIVSGELSYIWNVPEHAREACLPRLSRWCEGAFDMERPAAIPREVSWTIHRKRPPLSRGNPVTPGRR